MCRKQRTYVRTGQASEQARFWAEVLLRAFAFNLSHLPAPFQKHPNAFSRAQPIDLHEQTIFVCNVHLRHLILHLRLAQSFVEIPRQLRQLPSFPGGDGCNCISRMLVRKSWHASHVWSTSAYVSSPPFDVDRTIFGHVGIPSILVVEKVQACWVLKFARSSLLQMLLLWGWGRRGGG